MSNLYKNHCRNWGKRRDEPTGNNFGLTEDFPMRLNQSIFQIINYERKAWSNFARVNQRPAFSVISRQVRPHVSLSSSGAIRRQRGGKSGQSSQVRRCHVGRFRRAKGWQGRGGERDSRPLYLPRPVYL